MSDDRANLIAQYLAGRDERCPVCKYNLRGCESEHCPECGAGLTLGLNIGAPPKHHDGWWLAGVIGLAISTATTAAVLFLLFDKVASIIENPNQAQMVAAGYASPSELPNWGAIIRMAFFTGLLALALGIFTMSRLHMRAIRLWLRIVLACAASVSPAIVLLAIRVLF